MQWAVRDEGCGEGWTIPWASIYRDSLVVALAPFSQMGRLLGEVDGALMTQLLSLGAFSR